MNSNNRVLCDSDYKATSKEHNYNKQKIIDSNWKGGGGIFTWKDGSAIRYSIWYGKPLKKNQLYLL